MRNFPDLNIWQPQSLQYGEIEGRQLPLLVGLVVDIVHHQSPVPPLDNEVGIESYGEVGIGYFGNILDINSN